MNIKKRLTLFLSFLLVGVVVIAGFAESAEASTNRTAIIDEVVGTVWIQKAGGHLTLRAYSGMSLQQGDRLTTSGDYSSANVVISDTKDKFTIGKNAEITFTDLGIHAGHPITRVTVWSGSIFSSVASITNEHDIFEILTSGQTMSAKGTNFFVGVDPVTGDSTLYVFSGVVQQGQTNSTSDRGSYPTTIYPSEQITVPQGSSSNQIEVPPSILDIDAVANQLTPAVIEALISNKNRIDRENEEFLKRLKDEGSSSPNDFEHLDDLDRFKGNLDILIANLAKKAIDKGAINESALKQMLAKQKSDLNIDSPKELEYTKAEKEKLDKLNKLKEERQRQAQQEKDKQEAIKRQNEELLKRLQAERDQRAEQERKRMEELRQAAENRLKEQLSAKEFASFENNKDKKEDERRNQDAAANEVKKKSEPISRPGSSGSSRPTPLNPDQELQNAIESIPIGYDKPFYYTEESVDALHMVLELPQETNAEKLSKAKAIRDAIAGLVKISLGDIELIQADIESDQIFVLWKNYQGSVKYDYYLNDQLVRSEEFGIDSEESFLEDLISLGPDDLASNEEHTLRIVSVGENGQAIAQVAIKFTLAPKTIEGLEEWFDGNSLYLSWNQTDEETRYEIYLNDDIIKEILPSPDDSDLKQIEYIGYIEYMVENIERDRLNTIQIKAYNAENELVASRTLIRYFSNDVQVVDPD